MLLESHMRALMEAGDHAALARLAGDHAEGSIELSAHQWKLLMKHSQERVPELIPVVQQRLSVPADYTSILEALSQVADPRYQPSLDAWLRVHSSTAQYALYFRDAGLERREREGSGLIKLSDLGIEDQVTLRLPRVPLVLQQAPIARPPRAGGRTPSDSGSNDEEG